MKGQKKAHRALFWPFPKREGVALKGTAWLWKVPEGFPKGVHCAGTPEIDTVWDYKADRVLFEGALA